MHINKFVVGQLWRTRTEDIYAKVVAIKETAKQPVMVEYFYKNREDFVCENGCYGMEEGFQSPLDLITPISKCDFE